MVVIQKFKSEVRCCKKIKDSSCAYMQKQNMFINVGLYISNSLMTVNTTKIPSTNIKKLAKTTTGIDQLPDLKVLVYH